MRWVLCDVDDYLLAVMASDGVVQVCGLIALGQKDCGTPLAMFMGRFWVRQDKGKTTC